MTEQTLLQLDPAQVQAEGNSRYGLKDYRIESLMGDILDKGGVLVPVLVEALPEGAANGFTHKLTAGFYRHAAVSKLNAEQNAGLTLPALVYTPENELDRLKRQLSENLERENQSPMDRAVAIQQLEDAGVSRLDVRRTFSVLGGRKGNVLQPASNSYINMHLSFLDLSRSIQRKIHDGIIGTAAAYELTKIPRQKQDEIVKRIEEKRAKELEREARQDEREAMSQAKAEEKASRIATATQALADAEQVEVEAKAAFKAAQAAVAAAVVPADYFSKPKEEQQKIAAAVGEAKAALKDADKAVGKATKARGKAEETLKILTRTPAAEEEDETLPAPTVEEKRAAKARKDAKSGKKAKGISKEEVRQAAVEEGVTTGAKLDSMAGVRTGLKALQKSRHKKVQAISILFVRYFDGELNIGELDTELATLTGELKTRQA